MEIGVEGPQKLNIDLPPGLIGSFVNLTQTCILSEKREFFKLNYFYTSILMFSPPPTFPQSLPTFLPIELYILIFSLSCTNKNKKQNHETYIQKQIQNQK